MISLLLVLLPLLGGAPQFDAAPAGHLTIRIENLDRSPLRGATVTLALANGDERQIVITDADGMARFRDLHEGSRYKADCEIAGSVPVSVGPVLVDAGPTAPRLPAVIHVIMNPEYVF